VSQLAVCTIGATNYAAHMRVLVESLRRFHPDVPVFALVGGSDRHPTPIAGARGLDLADLSPPGLTAMLVRYERKQVMMAMKPVLVRYLLERGYQTVLFLDPDMLVTATLDPVLRIVAEHALTLTPHVRPAFGAFGDHERARQILLAGMFNGGFVGATRRPETLRFLAWWAERLRLHCREEVHEGICFDQRWLDLAPAFVDELHLLGDPGCNAAYWDLPELALERGPDGIRADGAPLRLFHFSGFDPSAPEMVSHYRPGVRVDALCPCPVLFADYARRLQAAGWADCARAPWPWDGWRRLLRRANQQRWRVRDALRRRRAFRA
jgi:hypothetical protein